MIFHLSQNMYSKTNQTVQTAHNVLLIQLLFAFQVFEHHGKTNLISRLTRNLKKTTCPHTHHGKINIL